MALAQELEIMTKTPLFDLLESCQEFSCWATGESTLVRHVELETRNPYWEFTDKGLDQYEYYARNGFVLRIGPIGAFTAPQVATIVDSTTRAYVHEGLFGDFPWENLRERHRLESAMAGGFDNQRLIIAVSDVTDTQFIGGCMVVPGNSQWLLNDTVGSPESTLPTLFSLSFLPSQTSQVREDESVCFTRFHRQPDELLIDWTAEERRRFSMETLSGMARAVDAWAKKSGRNIKYGILDTHDKRIVNTLLRFWGGRLVTSEAVATPQILLPNPLGRHYQQGKTFFVVDFDFATQLQKAREADRQLGQKTVYSGHK